MSNQQSSQRERCCAEWEPGIAAIDHYIKLQYARTGIDGYKGKPFSFCPWCGASKTSAVSEIEAQQNAAAQADQVQNVTRAHADQGQPASAAPTGDKSQPLEYTEAEAHSAFEWMRVFALDGSREAAIMLCEVARLNAARSATGAPLKPTQAMYDAGMKYLHGRGTAWCINDLYRAMVAATDSGSESGPTSTRRDK